MPGSKMAFAGIKHESDMADLIAYLMTFSADGRQQKSSPSANWRCSPRLRELFALSVSAIALGIA